MGRSTPDRPPAYRPDPPPAPPRQAGFVGVSDFVLLSNNATLPKVGLRRCDYCRRWNAGTTCDGCGAPIDCSQTQLRPSFPQNRLVR